MNKKQALFTVFLVVLIDLMGFGIVLPLLPYVSIRFSATPLEVGLLYSVYSFAQLVFSPLWGSWSDRIGRRPIMLLSTFGSCSSYLLFAFAPSLAFLFLSRALAGIMGGNISTAQAYIADVTPPEERAKGMGLIGAAFGLGFALGPALSGALMLPAVQNALQGLFPRDGSLEAHPFVLPGLAAALFSFASFLLVFFKLPESVSAGTGADAERIQKSSIFTGSFWSPLFKPTGDGLARLLFLTLIVSIGQSCLYSAFPLFSQRELLLPASAVGALFLWMGVIAILVQGGLIRVLVSSFGEARLLLAGNFLLTLGLILIPFSSSAKSLAVYLGILSLGANIGAPALSSLISKKAPSARVGEAMGRSQGMAALGRVIGPAWGGFWFSVNPKTPFFLTAAVVSLSIYLGWLASREPVS